MRTVLRYDLLLTGGLDDDLIKRMQVEITCTFAPPVYSPTTMDEIPFLIRDVLVDGKEPAYEVREFLLDALGGRNALKDQVLMQAKGASA